MSFHDGVFYAAILGMLAIFVAVAHDLAAPMIRSWKAKRQREVRAEDAETIKALVDRIKLLEARIDEDNEVRLCGCDLGDHDIYDDGEACEHDHQCIRTCRAIAKIYGELVTCLRDMVAQHCASPLDDGVIRDDCVSSNENALKLLMDLGEAELVSPTTWRLRGR